MRVRRRFCRPFFAFFALVALAACNEIAGIGAPILESSDASVTSPPEDSGAAASDANGVSPPPGSDATSPGGDANGGEDAGGGDDGATLKDANIPDTNVPDTFTPPPPAGKPGFDITAGGTYGKSASFTLIATVGESPGGNNVGTSSHFVLKAGVIAVTQPN